MIVYFGGPIRVGEKKREQQLLSLGANRCISFLSEKNNFKKLVKLLSCKMRKQNAEF